MKIYKYIIAFSLAIFSFASCIDLDTYPEGDIITSQQKEEALTLDGSKAEAGVNAIFAQFTIATTLSDGHDDFGYPALMLMYDQAGADMVGPDVGYNWFRSSMTYLNRTVTSSTTYLTWSYMYKVIYAANNVIEPIDLETEDPLLQFYGAQGYAGRAFAYWVLAQSYQFNYLGNESKPCVPIVTEENAAVVGVEGAPRASVQDVYALIISDLDKAINFLEKTDFTKSDKRYVSKATAYGLRARVHLTMHKYKEAADDAKKAIESFEGIGKPYSIQNVSSPCFVDVSETAWMWGIIITDQDRATTTGIVNFPSHMGPFNDGYAITFGGRLINKKLYNSIPATDVRKGWWLDENGKSKNLSDEEQKFMTDNEFLPYSQVKYGPDPDKGVGNNSHASDVPLMRIEEMHLILAEGLVQTGDVSGGKSKLVDLIKTYRDPEYDPAANTKEQVLEEIYRQRRIELWGEGLSFFDIMRLGKGVDRRGAGYPDPTSIFNIPGNDPIFLYLIPESETQSNLQIPDSENNPAASRPTPVTDID